MISTPSSACCTWCNDNWTDLLNVLYLFSRSSVTWSLVVFWGPKYRQTCTKIHKYKNVKIRMISTPSSAWLSPMYWLLNWCSDSQRNPLSQYVLHRPVIDYLQYQAGKFKNCKSTNIQVKTGKTQFVCSHPSNLRAFLESRTRCLNICVSPFDVAALPSIADFSISSAPNFATKTKWNGGWQ